MVDNARVGSKVFISIPSVCSVLGITSQNQTNRIRKHAILSQGAEMIAIKTRGGTQPTWCLDVDMIPAWLILIQPQRAKRELQQNIYN